MYFENALYVKMIYPPHNAHDHTWPRITSLGNGLTQADGEGVSSGCINCMLKRERGKPNNRSNHGGSELDQSELQVQRARLEGRA